MHAVFVNSPTRVSHQLIAFMKKLIVTIAVALGSVSFSLAQYSFALDKLHTSVQFRIKQAGKNLINGRFNQFEGRLSYDPEDLSTARLDFKVKVQSVNTSNQEWDRLLKKSQFFNVSQHPDIVFKSTQFQVKGRKILISGQLRIQNITKKVTFEAKDTGVRRVRQDGYRKGFVASGKIKRSDFNIKYGLKEGLFDDEVEFFVFAEYVQGK